VKTRRAQELLRAIGFPLKLDGQLGPTTRQAIRDFQRGYAFGARKIETTGTLNSETVAAIKNSAEKGGRCSPNFFYRNFKSKGNGWIRVNRPFVKGLEKYRKKYGPVSILSGYRDAAHNARTPGAASQSQHTDITVGGKTYLGGNAADLSPAKAKLAGVKALKEFSGVGINKDGTVRHVDKRHLAFNPTRGTVTNPTVWTYA
jgi:peptidoglycan hydrolase-like protein with peptidoglycan-binding domain